MNYGIINKEIIEYEIPDKQREAEVRGEISEIAGTKIPLIIDEVVSKYFGNEDLLRIDRIDIDLGTLGFDNLEENFIERFREQFEEEIIKYKPNPPEYLSPLEKIPSVEFDFELITFFITTGSLPWWVTNKHDVKIDKILERVIKEYKFNLLQFLKDSVGNHTIINRIVSQFSTSSIESLNILIKESDSSLNRFYEFANNIFEVELGRLISKTIFERRLLESLISNLPHTGKTEDRIELRILDFAASIVSTALPAPSKTKTLFRTILESEVYKNQPYVSSVEKLIAEYLDYGEFEIQKDLPVMIKQIKEIISRSIMELGIKDKIESKESFKRINISDWGIQKSSLPTAKDFETELTGNKRKPKKIKLEPAKKTGDELHHLKKDKTFQIRKEVLKDIPDKQKSNSKIDKEEKPEYPTKEIIDAKRHIKQIDKKEDGYLRKPKIEMYEPVKFYIDNSGLVLIAAFIPAFFKTLGLIENDKFKNNKAAERGVHLLQNIVNSKVNSPEYVLTLNKILCGLDVSQPVVKSIRISKHEKEECTILLNSVIKNWSALKNTSIEGLRNSFLIRSGIITVEENQFNLKIERKPFDILLDRLPWSISIIKHNWMNKPIYVEW